MYTDLQTVAQIKEILGFVEIFNASGQPKAWSLRLPQPTDFSPQRAIQGPNLVRNPFRLISACIYMNKYVDI